MPSSKGLGILMEDQLAWKITTVKHEALGLSSRSVVCHAIPHFPSEPSPDSVLLPLWQEKAILKSLVYPIHFSYEMAACLCGRARLKYSWKGYKGNEGKRWDCWQMEKGLLDMKPLTATLHLTSGKQQMHFLN